VLISLKLPALFILYSNTSHEEIKQNKAVLEVFEGKSSKYYFKQVVTEISREAAVSSVNGIMNLRRN
jgi:hypothetical protein